jgi:hypothetical protein
MSHGLGYSLSEQAARLAGAIEVEMVSEQDASATLESRVSIETFHSNGYDVGSLQAIWKKRRHCIGLFPQPQNKCL